MANSQGQQPNLERYVVIHVATTCDEHGVYVTKDSAEVIELGWILLDAKSCEEVGTPLRLCLSSPSPLDLEPHVELSSRAELTLNFSPDHPRQRLGQADQHAHHPLVQ